MEPASGTGVFAIRVHPLPAGVAGLMYAVKRTGCGADIALTAGNDPIGKRANHNLGLW